MSWTGKLRGPAFDPIEFRMREIRTEKLVDAKGRKMPTAMAEVVSAAQVEAEDTASKAQEREMLAAMKSSPDDSMADWAKACGWFQPKDETAPYKALAQRVLARLEKKGFVMNGAGGWSITKQGKTLPK